MQVASGTAATSGLRAFVRDTLRCTCPESVFESVERGSLPDAGGEPVTRLVIGGRLLIYVAKGKPEAAQLAALADAGRRDRDVNGLNRFRLVVGLPAGEGEDAALETAFRGAVRDDPKAHLHCVPTAACDAALSER